MISNVEFKKFKKVNKSSRKIKIIDISRFLVLQNLKHNVNIFI